jgi:hypothetical protein
MSEKRTRIADIRERNRKITHGVNERHEHANLEVELLLGIREDLAELTELVRKIAEPDPLDVMKKTEPMPEPEVKPTLWGRLRGGG